jgi:hypothetical protein
MIMYVPVCEWIMPYMINSCIEPEAQDVRA